MMQLCREEALRGGAGQPALFTMRLRPGLAHA